MPFPPTYFPVTYYAPVYWPPGGELAGIFSIDAVIRRTLEHSFSTDAVLVDTKSGTFPAQAIIEKTVQAGFVANALLRDTRTGGFGIDAVIIDNAYLELAWRDVTNYLKWTDLTPFVGWTESSRFLGWANSTDFAAWAKSERLLGWSDSTRFLGWTDTGMRLSWNDTTYHLDWSDITAFLNWADTTSRIGWTQTAPILGWTRSVYMGEFVTGDTGPKLEGVIHRLGADPSTTAEDLTDCTVKFQMRKANDVNYTVNAAATIEDAIDGSVSYSWAANDLNEPGTYQGRWEITYGEPLALQTTLDGSDVTTVSVAEPIPSVVPATGYIRIERDSGATTRHAYTSWSGSDFIIASTDFSSDNATAANVVVAETTIVTTAYQDVIVVRQ